MRTIALLLFLPMLIISGSAYAASISEIQKRWAIANYELAGDSQAEAFEALIADIAQQAETDQSAELLIWKGIVESSYAGKAGGLDALGLVKSARSALEAALETNPDALDGSAFTSLGALYYQVPPWPIAFGSNKKARRYLEKAIEINPDGIDSNYFYGAFLIEEKEYFAARQALQKAMQAPTRADRPIADKGRRAEIQALLTDLSARGA